jgi:hypothetical protein
MTAISEINCQKEDKGDEGDNRDEVEAKAVIKMDILVVIKITVRTIRAKNQILLVTIVAIRTISLLTTMLHVTLIEDSWILNPTNLAISEP